MLDRNIPFYNTILRCDKYEVKKSVIPEGYAIVSYAEGYETGWALLEYAIGDFSSINEAKEYFMSTYMVNNRTDDILFAINKEGDVVGSCIAWNDEKNGEKVNSLHWLVVDERHQGIGLGRALCIETMNRFSIHNNEAIYIHTQPWSWKAICLYISLGFKLQKTDTFSTYCNQYGEAISTLKNVLPGEIFHKLSDNTED